MFNLIVGSIFIKLKFKDMSSKEMRFILIGSNHQCIGIMAVFHIRHRIQTLYFNYKSKLSPLPFSTFDDLKKAFGNQISMNFAF